MQTKIRYFIPGMVSLLIILCLVIGPVAAATPFNLQGSAFTRFTSYQSSGSPYATGLASHAATGYYANPARYSSINSTIFSVPTSTFNVPGGSPSSVFTIPDMSSPVDYSSAGWDALFTSPKPASGGGCGG